MAQDFEALLVDTRDGVATVTLNRPERRNALEPRIFAELVHAFRALDENDDVRAIVLTGAGRDFCAGADLSGDSEVFGEEALRLGRELDPQRLLTPVIAAVNGTAAGGGLTLALQCDLVLVADDATLALPFVRRGLVAERNAHWILPRLIGVQRSAELLLTGRKLDGAEAARLGLALRALPRDAVLPEAQRIAAEIAAHVAPTAASATKRLLYAALRESNPDVSRALEREVFFALAAGPDCREGVEALREKRQPRWKQGKRDVPDALRDTDKD